MPIIQQEHNFLLNPPEPVEAQLSDYGVPTDWKIKMRFVNIIPDAVTISMYENGVTVLEKVEGRALVNPDESTNLQIPIKFHFGSILAWVDMLKRELSKVSCWFFSLFS